MVPVRACDGYGQNVVKMLPARGRLPYIRLVWGTVLSPRFLNLLMESPTVMQDCCTLNINELQM